MKKLFFLQLIIACSFSLALHAQDSAKKASTTKPAAVKPSKFAAPPYSKLPDTAKQVDNSLSGQYKYLLTKVYNYQQPLLGAYHKNVMDALVHTRHALRDTAAKLSVANKTIDSLNKAIKANEQTLSASNEKVNAIDFVGITLPKSSYNLIMWGLVIVFGAAAAVVIARSGSYSREAKYRTQL